MEKKYNKAELFFIIIMISAVSFSSCSTSKKLIKMDEQVLSGDPFIENLLAKYPAFFSNVLLNRDSFRVQIIYTSIDRTESNKPLFKTYYFNVHPDVYFYPASTVKMPVAFLALEKLNELSGRNVTKHTSMITGVGNSGQTAVLNDPQSSDGRPTIAQYIRKIFLVSDNDAFNRLYEFVGPAYIRERLQAMGYEHTEIFHRLSLPLSLQQNFELNPVSFLDTSARVLFEEPSRTYPINISRRADFLGKGYLEKGQLISKPFDFSKKNKVILSDLHNMLQAVLFPESVPLKNRFRLSESDYRFLRRAMSQYPSESTWPAFMPDSFPDAYCKLLYWGDAKETLPKHLRIFNKVGEAYGFLTDVAYIVDFEKKIEFMLSATIYCNSDGVFNDDKYDYEIIGIPFLKNLGGVFYEYELNRKRNFPPDLSEFRFEYESSDE
ncbi:MAG TPA: serine hydrolase [Flavitalea sp.]|nr:serine hydrolase [Flavitalea sp.]